MAASKPPSKKKALSGVASDMANLSDAGYLRGQILVAMPQMRDPRFDKSLILMCGHDSDGAMGIVFNKILTEMSFQDLIDQSDFQSEQQISDRPLYYGGPVEIGRGFVLHSSDHLDKASLLITDDVALTASANILESLAKEKGPDHALVALGYAGWSPGQLEGEILQNSWLIFPADGSIIFDANPETLWERTLKKFGIDPNFLSTQAGHA